jgi:hypothetical protein
VEPRAAVDLRRQPETLDGGPVGSEEWIDPAITLGLDERGIDTNRLSLVCRLQ